jgi:hypothetical protein
MATNDDDTNDDDDDIIPDNRMAEQVLAGRAERLARRKGHQRHWFPHHRQTR